MAPSNDINICIKICRVLLAMYNLVTNIYSNETGFIIIFSFNRILFAVLHYIESANYLSKREDLTLVLQEARTTLNIIQSHQAILFAFTIYSMLCREITYRNTRQLAGAILVEMFALFMFEIFVYNALIEYINSSDMVGIQDSYIHLFILYVLSFIFIISIYLLITFYFAIKPVHTMYKVTKRMRYLWQVMIGDILCFILCLFILFVYAGNVFWMLQQPYRFVCRSFPSLYKCT
ncbi:hypothetical protein NEPAR04_0795 [Nematocida parisii]|nr:hypothetical protein NEPAR03_2272 [Nematocida parisii]KAI5131013.1 hypothetical protein NEPAR08_2307 [Nematocida parisii]KAI5141225.1 hypothetical protein NEPAR04_0795 [Nematocida parisii]